MVSTDSLEQVIADLEAAASELPLAQVPTDIVPGEGLAEAEIMLIGEAPGFEEAKQRRPFVGRSGQLLRKTLQHLKFDPNQLFISNIVKVRPPDNRDPLPVEITAYRPFLDREIEIIKPKLIVTLGRYSMAKFLPEVKISQVHGRLHKVKWQGRTIYVLPMYHPAAALRATQVKQSFIEDFAKIEKVLTWIKEQLPAEQLQTEVEEALL